MKEQTAQRIIKFRAWDPVIKSMHHSSGEFHQIVYGGASDDVAIGLSLHYSIKNWDRWGDGKKQRSIREIIFMQFTGLHDKNGKEIYEGDIVRYCYGRHQLPLPTRDLFTTARVYFLNGAFTRGGLPPYSFQGCEVIGNIYENPKMAEGHQDPPSPLTKE